MLENGTFWRFKLKILLGAESYIGKYWSDGVSKFRIAELGLRISTRDKTSGRESFGIKSFDPWSHNRWFHSRKTPLYVIGACLWPERKSMAAVLI